MSITDDTYEPFELKEKLEKVCNEVAQTVVEATTDGLKDGLFQVVSEQFQNLMLYTLYGRGDETVEKCVENIKIAMESYGAVSIKLIADNILKEESK